MFLANREIQGNMVALFFARQNVKKTTNAAKSSLSRISTPTRLESLLGDTLSIAQLDGFNFLFYLNSAFFFLSVS